MEEANIGLTMIRIYLPLSSIGCAMARFFAPPPGPRTGKRLCAWLLRILGSPLWWKDCAKTDEGHDIVTHVANTPRKRKKTTVAEYLELNLKNAVPSLNFVKFPTSDSDTRPRKGEKTWKSVSTTSRQFRKKATPSAQSLIVGPTTPTSWFWGNFVIIS